MNSMYDDRKRLEKIRIAVKTRVKANFMDVSIYKEFDEKLCNDFVYCLNAYLMGDTKTNTQVVKVISFPKNWREAVKEELFKSKHIPDYIKKKYPVKYKQVNVEEHTTTITNIYPNFDMVLPKDQMYCDVLVRRATPNYYE